ncbi:MAG: ATP-binding domain-containing protein, partial [Micropruina sp.]
PVVIRDAPQAPHLQWAEPDDVIALAVDQAQQHAGRGRFVGVIAPDNVIDAVADAFRAAEVNFKSASSGELGQSINLMSAVESKGLEFDAIVVVEPAQIGRQNSHGLRHLYIALTRTTKYMSVVYSEPMAEIGLVVGQPQVEVVALPEPAPQRDQPMLGEKRQPDDRGAKTPSFQRLIDACADDLASEIREAVAPKAHAALLHALAARLDLSITVESQDG